MKNSKWRLWVVAMHRFKLMMHAPFRTANIMNEYNGVNPQKNAFHQKMLFGMVWHIEICCTIYRDVASMWIRTIKCRITPLILSEYELEIPTATDCFPLLYEWISILKPRYFMRCTNITVYHTAEEYSSLFTRFCCIHPRKMIEFEIEIVYKNDIHFHSQLKLKLNLNEVLSLTEATL